MTRAIVLLLLSLCITVLVLSPADSQAGGCPQGVVIRSSSYPTVSQAAYAPYVAPTYVTPAAAQYQYVPVVIPLYSAVVTAYPGQAGTGSSARDSKIEALLERLVERTGRPSPPVSGQDQSAAILSGLKEMSDQLRTLSGRLDRLEGRPRVDSPPPPAPAPRPGPMSGAEGRLPAGQKFLSNLRSDCAACHDASVAKRLGKGFTLTQAGQIADLTPEAYGKIIKRVVSREMPPGGGFSASRIVTFLESLTEE